MLGFGRGIADKFELDSAYYPGIGAFMPGIARLLLALVVGCAVADACARSGGSPGMERGADALGPARTRGQPIAGGFSRHTRQCRGQGGQGPRAGAERQRSFKPGTSDADVAGLAQRTGLAMARSRQITPSMHVLYLQKTLYGADVHALLKKLRADPAVQFADVDQRRYPHAVPDDPLIRADRRAPAVSGSCRRPSATTIMVGGVATQDLSATDAVSAWAITTGSTGTVIADVDTGVRFDHPDLLRAGFGGRLLPGYDFVGEDLNPTTGAALGTFLIANDGDGWDPDPSDPGDWINSTDQQNTVLFPGRELPVSRQLLARNARRGRSRRAHQQRRRHRRDDVESLSIAGARAR